jgi:putative serine protease PepD
VSAPPRLNPFIAAGVLALVLTAFVFYQWGSRGPAAPATAASPSPSASATAPPSTAEIYQAVAPSIVSVEANEGSTVSAGTGVVVNADGTILTALHVVKDAKAIRVVFADATTSAAKIIDAEPTMDIATLAPSTMPSLLVPAVLGGAPAVGDDVIAIGDQLGLTRTTTTGVVSGLGRESDGPEGAKLTGLIQFDAAVNYGSSGGPLLNAQGAVVGIVVALINPTKDGTFIGVGLAVPIGSALGGGNGDRGPQQ